MSAELTILYRGHLSSCNYACSYCPFAKRHETAAELARDRDALQRFCTWIQSDSDRSLAIFFTPWGEALVRPWYRQAIEELSRNPRICRVAVQTNLSCDLGWLDDVQTPKLGLWCTFHPSQTSIDTFLDQCLMLRQLGVRHSVGMVGLPADFDAIARMRDALPDETYLWINAWDVGEGVKYDYSDGQRDFLTRMDPLFPVNLADHPSHGRACRTGESVISVDGEGTVRRCHFVREPLGNLYETPLADLLGERPCPNRTCNCYIGYVHLETAQLDPIFGDGVLERIPM
jgi:MoaA/NifB/PqqE/SkfB family radical SAM enzyme